ncbi:MAG: bacterial Ig-like domain-containing protein, partial [Erysipelotrichaceae bacterium]|nr:bacterial Ig-like domain-containing protein [Erysipelotrichaceae bacterium]
PYWGEKAAANYYKLDKTLGFKDYHSYAIGIIRGGGRINLYRDEECDRLLFRVSGIEDYALIILEEKEEVYKVQVDPSFSDEYRYDFTSSVAYVPKDYFDHVFNEENIHDNELVTVTFNADGGNIDRKETIEIRFLKGNVPVIADPERDGYAFTGFEPELTAADEDASYTATYRKIESVSIAKGLKTSVEQGSYLDLRNAYLTVVYEDGRKENIEIDTDMLSGIDADENGKQALIVTFNGVSDSIDVNVSKDLRELNERISSLIDRNIGLYKDTGIYDTAEIKEIKKNLRKVDYLYDMEKIRQIDKIMLEEYRGRANYRIDDNDYDLSVSGLTLSLTDASITSPFRFFKNTYYVHTGDVSRKDKKTLQEIGEAYGFEAVDYLSIEYGLNLRKIEPDGAVIISLKLEDKETDKTYSVYRLDDNGDIVKCKTTQTNSYIQFLTKKSGSFVILAKDSVNNYDLPDYKENITGDNSDPDNNGLFIFGAILAALAVCGSILIIVYRNMERKEEKIWKDF